MLLIGVIFAATLEQGRKNEIHVLSLPNKLNHDQPGHDVLNLELPSALRYLLNAVFHAS